MCRLQRVKMAKDQKTMIEVGNATGREKKGIPDLRKDEIEISRDLEVIRRGIEICAKERGADRQNRSHGQVKIWIETRIEVTERKN